jgi:hypothetical protein
MASGRLQAVCRPPAASGALLAFAAMRLIAMRAPELDLYPEYVHVRVDDEKPTEALGALLRRAAEQCVEKSLLGAVWELRSSSLGVCLAIGNALDAMADLWRGSQRRLALLCADPAAKGACWYAALLAQRRGVALQSFYDEPAALEWLVGPGCVPGRFA